MNTLIELYCDRALENIIGPDTFRPENIIYLCTEEIIQDTRRQKIIKRFFASRGYNPNIIFTECSQFKADKIRQRLKKIARVHPDCAIDVTGGTDAALFAAGMFCAETGKPAFTYSRKRNMFYNINNAEFADNLPCELEYTVDEFFRMTGGTLRQGRVDNSILDKYLKSFEQFFKVFMRFRRDWIEEITFIQRISMCPKDEPIRLTVSGAYEQKGERGSRVRANEKLLRELERINYIKDLRIVPNERVSWVFKDEWTRNWLRDAGSVLELYIYKICRDMGIFSSIISSAVVDWDGTVSHESVSNEIDCVAARGILPVFISCKATEIKTEAINELAILRDRFGGKGAKAIIVSSENCNAAARHRAAQMGIAVIDYEELNARETEARILTIMKIEKEMVKG